MSDLKIGDVVYWYLNGFTDNSPLPGHVLEIHPGGMLTLAVCDLQSGWTTKRNVWQAGSSTLTDAPVVGMKNGSWANRPESFRMSSPVPQTKRTKETAPE